MRTFRRSAIIGFIALALSSTGHATCDPGYESCEPSVDETWAKIEGLLNSAFLTPYSIVSLDKFDGRSVETQDRKVYEMRFSAVLNYSGDKLRCRKSLCPELHNYLVEVDEARKKATIAGWLFLNERSEDGARARWLFLTQSGHWRLGNQKGTAARAITAIPLTRPT